MLAQWPNGMRLARTRYSLGWIEPQARLSPEVPPALRNAVVEGTRMRATRDLALSAAGAGGIDVLPGAWGVGDMADCSAESQQRLIGQLMDLGNRIDLIVVDAGNGSSRLVKRFWQAADQVLLLTTPDLTAVMDAYASIKVLAAGDDSIAIRPLVNMASSPVDVGDVYSRLARASLRFLGIRLPDAASLSADPRVAAGGKAQQPFVLAEPGSQAASEIYGLVGELSLSMKFTIYELSGESSASEEFVETAQPGLPKSR